MQIGAALTDIQGMTIEQINEELLRRYRTIEDHSELNIKITIDYGQNFAKIIGRTMTSSINDILR